MFAAVFAPGDVAALVSGYDAVAVFNPRKREFRDHETH